jgi:hypothetical protein
VVTTGERFSVNDRGQIRFRMLDVGCGTKPKGDVNVDFFSGGFNPQTGDQIKGEFMSPQEIPNFVRADAILCCRPVAGRHDNS